MIDPAAAFDPRRELAPIMAGLRDQRQRWRTANERHAELGSHGFPSRQSLARILGSLSAKLAIASPDRTRGRYFSLR